MSEPRYANPRNVIPKGQLSREQHDSQLVVPPSFVALYLTPGKIKPSAPREEILARYEFCEDLATTLTEHACTKLAALDLTEAQALTMIYRGMLGEEAVVSMAEAQWTVRRLAELLNWAQPDFDGASSAPD
jgi:hypothetical protein